MVEFRARFRLSDAVILLTSVGIAAGLAWSASNGFATQWAAAYGCNSRGSLSSLSACVLSAPWVHLSVMHAIVNLFAIALLWRRLRTEPPALLLAAGFGGSLIGMLLTSAAFGGAVAGASALVHGWLGLCLRSARPLRDAFDLFAVAALLALGATVPTWTGHLAALLFGVTMSLVLASKEARR